MHQFFSLFFVYIFFYFFTLFPNSFAENFLSSYTIFPENTFSTGQHFYNILIVDSKSTSLYVGAHGYVFRLWLYNINDTSSSNLFSSRKLDVGNEEHAECIRNGNSVNDCLNRVRLLFLKPNGQLMLCSSNAMKPQISTLDGNSLVDVESPRTIIGICSQHENLNTTAVYTEFGNPDDLPSVYSGIRTGLSLENHLIYRPPLVYNNKEVHSALRTVYTDSKWLNEPQFVGSFSINQYIYFFFREIAVEAESRSAVNSGLGSTGNDQVVYSRVARICKNDLGGKNVLRQVWSSFVKVRLNCSSVSQSSIPFYFDYIQSVFKLEQDSDTLFYATFTTPESPFQASAICVYSLIAINQVFDTGLYLEQPSSTSSWIPIQPDRVPINRPGRCKSESRLLSDEDLHFAKSHLLMADVISSDKPLIYRRGELLTKIVADQRNDRRVMLFALLPHKRAILKVRHVLTSSNKGRGYGQILAEYKLSSKTNVVHDIAILANEYLFIGESDRVSQFRLGQCSLYISCAACAIDLYCSWNIGRAECFSRELIHSTSVGWITASSSGAEFNDDEVEAKCRNYMKSISLTIYPGDSTHLQCSFAELLAVSDGEGYLYEWHFDREPISKKINSNHFVYASNCGIVLLNVTTAQSGTYQCLSRRNPIIEYVINVDDADCARPKSVKQFRSAQREWCKKYDNYKSNLLKWENLYEKNNSCSSQKLKGEKSTNNFV